ncbi:hypothetical protein HJ590_13145 [Naumannella sp. ID2617S]|nr:hypothetical protein [Naumannella sp. ID2617S]
MINLIRSRSWRKLRNLVERMPTASHYRQATADDEEAAERWLEAHPQETAPARPAWSETSYEAQLLTALGERIDQLILVTAGDNASSLKPWPRPETAIERIKRRQRMQRHDSLVSEVKAAMDRYERRADG